MPHFPCGLLFFKNNNNNNSNNNNLLSQTKVIRFKIPNGYKCETLKLMHL